MNYLTTLERKAYVRLCMRHFPTVSGHMGMYRRAYISLCILRFKGFAPSNLFLGKLVQCLWFSFQSSYLSSVRGFQMFQYFPKVQILCNKKSQKSWKKKDNFSGKDWCLLKTEGQNYSTGSLGSPTCQPYSTSNESNHSSRSLSTAQSLGSTQGECPHHRTTSVLQGQLQVWWMTPQGAEGGRPSCLLSPFVFAS